MVDSQEKAIANGQIIEDYPNDKYAPSCLICGLTKIGKTIHIQSQGNRMKFSATWQ